MLTREEFLALLARLRGDGDPLTADELRAFAGYVAAAPGDRETATDDELAEASTLIRQLGADDDTPLDVLEAAVEVVAGITSETDTRATADAEVEERRAALRAQLSGEPVAEEEPEPAAEPEPAPDGGEPVVEEPEPEPEPVEVVEVPEPVAASASRTAPRPAGTAAARRPAGQPAPRRAPAGPRIVRDGGGEFADLREASVEMLRRRESFLNAAPGVSEQVAVASIQFDYPEERRLDGMNAARNAAVLERLVHDLDGVTASALDALTAAGGFCAPPVPIYTIPRLAEADRPMRASLTGFQATRGAITYRPPPDFTSFRSAVTQWTRANDVTPGSDGPATKPCLTVPCLGTTTAYLYAVVECLKFGNFMAMADPETVANATENTAAAFASKSEGLILDALKAASTLVSGGQIFGAFRDLLFHWGVTAVGYRSRRRMRPDAVLELRAPSWVRDMIREDVARSLNAYADQYAVADDFINRALAVRNIRPFWYIDSPSVDGVGTNKSQVFGSQVAGALDDYPEYVQWQMSPPGTFVFMENGRLDLGVVRDSTLNSTNDYQTFMEDFEGVAQIGFQSLWGISTVCPNGASAGTTSPDNVCTTGGDYIPTGSGIGAFVAP